MRTLAVETSTLAGGAALLDGDLVVGEYVLDIRITHSERLMATIDRLLVDAGWSVRDLEGLAVSVGPGSFTGLRIGLSTVKGLALALAIPIAAVPTLDQIDSPYVQRPDPPRRGPSPAYVGVLGQRRLAAGETIEAADLVPVYLRPSEAELKRRGIAVS